MAGLGIEIRLDYKDAVPTTRESVVTASDRIIVKRLNDAVKRIQRKWPVVTGLSRRSFKLIRRAALVYELENAATVGERATLPPFRKDGKPRKVKNPNDKYAGFVREKGGGRRLTVTIVRPELKKARDAIRQDLERQLPKLLQQSIARASRSTANMRRTAARLGRIRL